MERERRKLREASAHAHAQWTQSLTRGERGKSNNDIVIQFDLNGGNRITDILRESLEESVLLGVR